ncbi:TetR family transcriptional regulator [Nocardia sp. NPDC051030]|uniref:TetR family transcriptional regulator n=1 Tax=Nocardia sp. NPDC051030 TaxID=3155162 RepID=UPI003434DF54
MARIAEARTPAAPGSRSQAARREKILEVAAELGATADFDRVQMLDVAKNAGVAIGTLYRYFPSKTQLFAGVFEAQIVHFAHREWTREDADPVTAVGENLVRLNRQLLRTPLLCSSMLRATAGNYMADAPDNPSWLGAEAALPQAIWNTLGNPVPDEQDHSAIRLLVYSWWGVLVSTLSGWVPGTRADEDMRVATRLILARYAR